MDQPHLCEIRVEGNLADCWAEWFKGLEIKKELNGLTALRGWIVD